MATQTNSQTKLKSAVSSAAPSSIPNVTQSTVEEIPSASRLDTAALSAGVKAVMGKNASSEAAAGSADASAAEKAKDDTGTALLASPPVLDAVEETGLIERHSIETRLPVQLNVGIPIRDFRVKNLLVLEPGSLIESSWVPGEDVPVASGEVHLAWSEFEVVDTQLAVRLTRLT